MIPQTQVQSSSGLTACLTAWTPPSAIRELAGETGDLIVELVDSYTADMEDRLHKIRSAMRTADPAVLRLEIHAIKGSSKQMAANGVASICEQIEEADPSGPVANLADLVRQLEAQVIEACDAMAWYLRTTQ